MLLPMLVQAPIPAVHEPRFIQSSPVQLSPYLLPSLDVLIQRAADSAHEFLKENARCLKSITNTGVYIEENFAQLLIQEVTGDLSVITRPFLCINTQTLNFKVTRRC